MSRPPRPSASRSAAESRYRELRHTAFQRAEADLAATGVLVELRAIEATALEAFKTWPPRRVAWPWPDIAADWRNGHPDRFELAVWSGGVLCGLAIGRPARTAAHLSLYYLESNPDPGNPLHLKVANVVIAASRAYALAIGKTELRMVDPLPHATAFYRSRVIGFELVIPRGQAPILPQEHMTLTMSRLTRRKAAPAAKGKRKSGAAMAIPTQEEARARLDSARDRPQPEPSERFIHRSRGQGCGSLHGSATTVACQAALAVPVAPFSNASARNYGFRQALAHKWVPVGFGGGGVSRIVNT